MNRLRSIALPLLVFGLLSGCVYGPPYFEDPFTPDPLLGPPGPPPPRRSAYEYRYLDRPEPYLYRQYPNRSEPYLYRQRPVPDDYSSEQRPESDLSDRQRYSDDRTAQTTPRYREEDLPNSQKRSDTPTDTQNVPTASRGSKPGRVKVPFPPYNELDVSGLSPGSLAKDPTSGKIFRIPR